MVVSTSKCSRGKGKKEEKGKKKGKEGKQS